MGNIILTTDCQRRCKYCFAKDNKKTPMQFEKEAFIKAVEWITKDNYMIPRIGLLGGEPTLHPDFLYFIDYLMSRKLNTVVFTNGMVEEYSFYNNIINIAHKNGVRHSSSLGFCLNVNEKKYRTEKEEILQKTFINTLGKVSSLSFNIFEPEFDPYFLIEYILQYKCMKNIRLGLAAPLGNRNKFLKIEDFKTVAEKLVEFVKEATRNNITVGFDCGFTKCMFSDIDQNVLHKLKVETWGFMCNPTLDIYPNLDVTYCYPLSGILKEKMDNWESAMELYIHWEDVIKEYENIYNECESCTYFKTQICNGGCKAHKVNG
jgi:radical SAM protein with 4Fe4S-binding SPASM domain